MGKRVMGENWLRDLNAKRVASDINYCCMFWRENWPGLEEKTVRCPACGKTFKGIGATLYSEAELMTWSVSAETLSDEVSIFSGKSLKEVNIKIGRGFR